MRPQVFYALAHYRIQILLVTALVFENKITVKSNFIEGIEHFLDVERPATEICIGPFGENHVLKVKHNKLFPDNPVPFAGIYASAVDSMPSS